MLDDIKTGSTVRFKIIKDPSNVAAKKTLVRLLSKDPQVKARNKHLRKVRACKYNPSMRGGRLYGGRMVKLRPVHGATGEEGQVVATMDVLNALRSVSRFVEVAKA